MVVQGKYAEALSVVEGELGNKVVHQPSNFLRLKRATYHTHLGQWQAAADVYRDLIKDELVDANPLLLYSTVCCPHFIHSEALSSLLQYYTYKINAAILPFLMTSEKWMV